MAAAHTGMNRQKDGDLFFSAFVNNPEKTLDGFLVGLIKNGAKHRLHETLLDCYFRRKPLPTSTFRAAASEGSDVECKAISLLFTLLHNHEATAPSWPLKPPEEEEEEEKQEVTQSLADATD